MIQYTAQLLDLRYVFRVANKNNTTTSKVKDVLRSLNVFKYQQYKRRGTRAGQKVKSRIYSIEPVIGHRPDKERHGNDRSLDNLITVPIAKPDKIDTLRTMVVNFQSFMPKRAEFWHLLNTMKPDIIIGTETWLKPDDVKDAEVIPPELGYNLNRKERTNGWGGIFIATKSNLKVRKIPLDPPHDEILLVKIETQRNEKPLTIGAIYRTPSHNSMEQITAITNCLDNINKNDIIWLGGDTNLPDIDWKEEKIAKRQYPAQINAAFLNKICDLGLTQVVDVPTRKHNILDTFFTNRPGLMQNTFTIPGVSDHDIVISENCVSTSKVEQNPRIVNVWKKADIDQIRKETKELSESIMAAQDLSVEQTWEKISRHLKETMITNVPTKTLSKKFNQPWITHKLKTLSRKKKKAWKKAKQTGSPTAKAKFKQIKKETQIENRRAYQNFVNKLLSEDPKKEMWKFIKSRKCDQTGVAPLTKEGVVFASNEEKANALNDQFCSVFTQENLHNLPNIVNVTDQILPDIHVSEDGVQKLLANLDPKKASGPDEIPARLLQLVSAELAPALTKLFQSSLDTCTLPEIWKHATVQPIFKKGDRGMAANYRPISLTCICCKMLEHIVRTEITRHLEDNHLLNENQHGFRKGKSCETQLIAIVNDIAETLNNRGQTDAILLDFAKAFDKVPHQRLLIKLTAYGIKNKTLNWIKCFLEGRSQEVVVSGYKSGIGKVTSGVPQGSVLGPTLFLVYINDIGDNIKATVRLFADDTILYQEINEHTDTASLNRDLSRLQEWEEKWQMNFNTSKCNVLTFTNKREPIKTKYHLHNEALEQVKSAKYLGVELSENLRWKTHIASICRKANKALGFLMRNLKGCPAPILVNCYKSLVRPIVEYADTVWDPHYQCDIDAIERIQKRAARRILNNFSHSESSEQLVEKMGLETLKRRRKMRKCTTFFKFFNGTSPTESVATLTPADPRTRGHKHKFTIPKSNNNCHLYSFIPSTIRMWNNLPDFVVESKDVKQFQASLLTVDWSS